MAIILCEFDLKIKHAKEKENKVVNVFSKKFLVGTISIYKTNIRERLRMPYMEMCIIFK